MNLPATFDHELAVPTSPSTGTYMETVDSQRAIQEVQAAFVIAKKFPRNEHESLVKIVNACKRRRLAESAIYAYPKGGQKVSGPSIRLAETLAKYWGNIDYGFKVLSFDETESLVRAYCTDLETNVTKKIEFTVEHCRWTKKDGRKHLDDPRDIYEMIANNAARRVRNCILATIPDDIREEAQEVCEKTLLNSVGDLPSKIKKMVIAFNEISVSPAMIEQKLGHKIEATTIEEYVNFTKIYKSIIDGFAPASSYFEFPKSESKHEAPKIFFSINNAEQLKEARQIMDRMKVAKDSQTVILDALEGKDMETELPKLIESELSK